ncbi:hypothetical protein [Streptomyces sp. ITFR-6]|uniref:hypothetical protein n=1 Tax=Streptomyces sp. ITFR-6 TaxID=3075197 RepID=UPI00288B60A1|nr:hypothetical protein [Streptomyces sp. ITFR-6]WNI29811.1 hypothetical protein RLT59_14180 [Streptomyces sp. ITFR-6]
MRVLLYLMFGLTLLGGVDVLNSLLGLGSRITPMLSLMALYAVVPGIAALILARLVWTGGKAVWIGLIVLQVWLLAGGIVNLYEGSTRGLSQLLLPGVLLALAGVGASRSWFELPPQQRAVRPRWTRERFRREAFPSLPHLITWRRNRGQTSVEYLGLITLVAVIIGVLLLSGTGPRSRAASRRRCAASSGRTTARATRSQGMTAGRAVIPPVATAAVLPQAVAVVGSPGATTLRGATPVVTTPAAVEATPGEETAAVATPVAMIPAAAEEATAVVTPAVVTPVEATPEGTPAAV